MASSRVQLLAKQLEAGRFAAMKSRLSLAVLFLSAVVASADPVGELASFSVFNNVDLAQLARGDAKTVRGAPMTTQRFQSVQTCWVSPGSPSQIATAMKNFNPVRHPELKVLFYANGSNFSQLNNPPGGGPVQWLVNATQTKPPELQISKAEAGKGGSFAEFWSGVLSARASAGVFGQPPYDHTGKDIRAGNEINAMLNEQPKIKKQFSGVIGGGGDKYWELIEVENRGVLTLGAGFTRSAGNAVQTGDVLYYASGGFYAGITLYQLWPVEVDGKPSTLIWRGDMISSEALAGLRGIERLGSESSMIKNISRAVRAIRSDIGGGR